MALKRTQSIILRLISFSFVAIVTTGILYAYEYTQSTTKVYDYFGHIQTTTEFHYPEEITSYTFGRTANDVPRDLEYINQLWCAPIDTTLPKVLTATRVAFYEDFIFQRNTPTVLTTTVSDHDTIATVGLYDAEAIRNSTYEEWTLGNITPRESSICHIATRVTGYTRMFGIPKITNYVGADFNYIVD